MKDVTSAMCTPTLKLPSGVEVFTIDPPNCRDLDDALSIEKTPDGNFRVGVHIADVTSFIKKGDYVDVEAYERATTFYPGQGRNPYILDFARFYVKKSFVLKFSFVLHILVHINLIFISAIIVQDMQFWKCF
jgi:hypothetical protein